MLTYDDAQVHAPATMTCLSYEEEDTCMSYKEEDTCTSARTGYHDLLGAERKAYIYIYI